MLLQEMKVNLKTLRTENRKSLRTSEHLALTKQIMILERDIKIEELK